MTSLTLAQEFAWSLATSLMACVTLFRAAGAGRCAGELYLADHRPRPGRGADPHRQVIVLERSDWQAWLDLTRPETELLRPLPAGSLAVEQVR